MKMFVTTFCAVIALLLATVALASKPATGIFLQNAYAFETANTQKNGAVFMQIVNQTPGNYRLVSAHASIAATVELHSHIVDGGIMMMRPVNSLNLPAGKTLTLEPSGHHIMLMGLQEPLRAGAAFPIKLIFENHAPVTIDVTIKKLGDAE